MFSRYRWQNYLKAGGQATVDMFARAFPDGDGEEDLGERFLDKMTELRSFYDPSETRDRIVERAVRTLLDNLEIWCVLPSYDFESQEAAMNAYWNSVYSSEDAGTEQEEASFFLNTIEIQSTLFALMMPSLFLPYYFRLNFNVISLIANEFDIALPKMPLKKYYRKRVDYYGEVSKTFLDFAKREGLSRHELYAFLYEYAPKVIGGCEAYIHSVDSLPPAKAAYFIGAAETDPYLCDDDGYITAWQCKTDSLATNAVGVGDNIVMYLTSPASAIDSIWRSVSESFDDPFFWYYRCTYIAERRTINQITLKDMQGDDLLKTLPIVRKNMQGVNGTEIDPEAFNRIIDLSNSGIPKLEGFTTPESRKLKNEKDVETELVIPLLERIGYANGEHVGGYIQQLHIPFGNHNEREIPDFVLSPIKRGGHTFAKALVEAKFSIKKTDDLEAAIAQARGYALHLKAPHVAIAAREGIWLLSEEDDFSKASECITWTDLSNPAHLQMVQRHLAS